jgi:hypothetical protein
VCDDDPPAVRAHGADAGVPQIEDVVDREIRGGRRQLRSRLRRDQEREDRKSETMAGDDLYGA